MRTNESLVEILAYLLVSLVGSLLVSLIVWLYA